MEELEKQIKDFGLNQIKVAEIMDSADTKIYKYVCMYCGRPNNYWKYECGRPECDSDLQYEKSLDDGNA